MIVLMVFNHLITTNYLSGWRKYAKCGLLCVKKFKISIFDQFSISSTWIWWTLQIMMMKLWKTFSTMWKHMITRLDGQIYLESSRFDKLKSFKNSRSLKFEQIKKIKQVKKFEKVKRTKTLVRFVRLARCSSHQRWAHSWDSV